MAISILLFVLIGIPIVLFLIMIYIGAYRYGSKDHSTSVHFIFGKNVSKEADEQQRLQDRKREENMRRNQEMEVKLTTESYKE